MKAYCRKTGDDSAARAALIAGGLARMGKRLDRGACACGDLIVPRYQWKERGPNEKHSRTRCLYKSERRVCRGARW